MTQSAHRRRAISTTLDLISTVYLPWYCLNTSSTLKDVWFGFPLVAFPQSAPRSGVSSAENPSDAEGLFLNRINWPPGLTQIAEKDQR